MPRYFFTTADGTRDRDEEGTSLPSDAAARLEGVRLAGAILADEPNVVWDGREFSVEVGDAENTLLFTIRVSALDSPAAKV